MFAVIQPGRSTTATFPSPSPLMPVSERTGSATAAACSRSSATTRRASPMVTCGPGLTQRIAVDAATFQSIIDVLLTPPRYVVGISGRRRSQRVPAIAPASGSAAAAARQDGRKLAKRVLRLEPQLLADPVAHEREREYLPVLRVGQAGHRGDAGEVAGLRPHQAECRSAERPEEAAGTERAVKARHRQAGEHRAQPSLALLGGQPHQDRKSV